MVWYFCLLWIWIYLSLDWTEFSTRYVPCIELFLCSIFMKSVHTFSNYLTYSKCCVNCGIECNGFFVLVWYNNKLGIIIILYILSGNRFNYFKIQLHFFLWRFFIFANDIDPNELACSILSGSSLIAKVCMNDSLVFWDNMFRGSIFSEQKREKQNFKFSILLISELLKAVLKQRSLHKTTNLKKYILEQYNHGQIIPRMDQTWDFGTNP